MWKYILRRGSLQQRRSVSILLIIALLLFFPIGGTQEMDADNYCGPKAVAHIVEHVNGSDFDGTVKRVEANLGPWEHLPEEAREAPSYEKQAWLLGTHIVTLPAAIRAKREGTQLG